MDKKTKVVRCGSHMSARIPFFVASKRSPDIFMEISFCRRTRVRHHVAQCSEVNRPSFVPDKKRGGKRYSVFTTLKGVFTITICELN